MTVEWSIKGPHFANCNCDFGCPCQFNALPTYGDCRAVAAWRIDEGHYGDVRLDGLYAINTWAWPKAVHEGNGEMQSIIDERADEAQRAALIAVLQGEGAEPGTIMLHIYRSMCTTLHAPIFAPIELELDVSGRNARLHVPGVIETAIEPIRNPVTGMEHTAQIGLPFGKEFNLAEVASGTTRGTGSVELAFQAKHAHLVMNETTNTGIRT